MLRSSAWNPTGKLSHWFQIAFQPCVSGVVFPAAICLVCTQQISHVAISRWLLLTFTPVLSTPISSNHCINILIILILIVFLCLGFFLLLLLLATVMGNVCSSLSSSPPCAVSMWTMAHHQVAAPWTPWPARAQASSCRLILSTASGESRSCTAPTATTTSRPSLCPETPPLPVTCECAPSPANLWPFIKMCYTKNSAYYDMVWTSIFQSRMFNFRLATQLWPWWNEIVLWSRLFLNLFNSISSHMPKLCGWHFAGVLILPL